MVALKELQDRFQEYLTDSDDNLILSQIQPDERFSAKKRLRVYHDAYRIRLFEILQADFPKTHTLLGDEEFGLAFNEYLATHPSHHFSVRYFGQHFHTFLKHTAPFKEYPVFSEMALFEWSVSYTLDAPTAPAITSEELMALPPESWPERRFTFHPSMTSHLFDWDVPQLWKEIDAEGPQREPIHLDSPVRWMFWRKGIASFFQSCSETEQTLFHAVKAQKCFAELCETLMDSFEEAEIPMIVAQTLNKWISESLITTVE